jgi:hypothetical protein
MCLRTLLDASLLAVQVMLAVAAEDEGLCMPAGAPVSTFTVALTQGGC